MGKYTNTFADERTWRSVRVQECKGSGVAAACASWRKSCSQDPNAIVRDTRTQDDAGKAIHSMSTALETARKRLAPVLAKNKITPVMRSPYNNTRELVHDWAEVLEGYHQRLLAAGTRYHGAFVKRKDFLKKLTLEQAAADRDLWPGFLKQAAREQATDAAESYALCRQRRYKEMVAQYGKRNDYNLALPLNQDLVNYFLNKQPLPPGRLTQIVEQAEDSLAGMLEGPNSCLDRFKQSPEMEQYLEMRFPTD
jgi:hypothetical protein